MPARDAVHDNVRHALVKDGWAIIADPHLIQYDEFTLFADLAAERIFAAEQNGNWIVVESKSFSSLSRMREFETALGQYLIYRTLLAHTFPEAKLYLAVDSKVFEAFFESAAIKLVLETFHVALIVFNPDTEEIEQWIRRPITGS